MPDSERPSRWTKTDFGLGSEIPSPLQLGYGGETEDDAPRQPIKFPLGTGGKLIHRTVRAGKAYDEDGKVIAFTDTDGVTWWRADAIYVE